MIWKEVFPEMAPQLYLWQELVLVYIGLYYSRTNKPNGDVDRSSYVAQKQQPNHHDI